MGEEHGERQQAVGNQTERPQLLAGNGGGYRAGAACTAREHIGGGRCYTR